MSACLLTMGTPAWRQAPRHALCLGCPASADAPRPLRLPRPHRRRPCSTCPVRVCSATAAWLSWLWCVATGRPLTPTASAWPTAAAWTRLQTVRGAGGRARRGPGAAPFDEAEGRGRSSAHGARVLPGPRPLPPTGMHVHLDTPMVQLSALLCLVPLALENTDMQARGAGGAGGAGGAARPLAVPGANRATTPTRLPCCLLPPPRPPCRCGSPSPACRPFWQPFRSTRARRRWSAKASSCWACWAKCAGGDAAASGAPARALRLLHCPARAAASQPSLRHPVCPAPTYREMRRRTKRFGP